MSDDTKTPDTLSRVAPEIRSRDAGAFNVAQFVRLTKTITLFVFVAFGILYLADKGLGQSDRDRERQEKEKKEMGFDAQIDGNAQRML